MFCSELEWIDDLGPPIYRLLFIRDVKRYVRLARFLEICILLHKFHLSPPRILFQKCW